MRTNGTRSNLASLFLPISLFSICLSRVMHFVTVSVSLLFAASALAYQINEPSETKGWTDSGLNTISWEMVDTDPKSVTPVLTNQNRTALPQDLILMVILSGSLLTVQVNPPNGGWPVGATFRVNFVRDSKHPNTILAQSSEFVISAVSTGTPTTTTTSFSYLRTSTSAAAAIASGTSEPDSSSAETTTAPATTSSNAPHLTDFSNNGLVSLFALFGAMLFWRGYVVTHT
ncbi:uncharacterized protein BT62DRAFT_657247 [Guyanagaster necrorhizus]|uniref:Yeast cell wall synthesis Kre9/Knh1-like N-terminal domain-containing protein n=1 Tax=Guyanagaster necrorhizus TaxID=856835 RepID=A0A9P7W091_9AGAR|nr:uncharacterized protein BT62DRAFT_657247 [Guyanagaster necrorhizus MCA 3950]KAG7449006.1 hypothetical protein BT62DRAFT_657247 [Guyanagaster necrorhizus MCA 3950]